MGVIKGSYLEQILSRLSGNPESVREVVRESVSLGAQSLLAMVPSLSDVLTESLTEKCVEVCTLLLDSTFFVLSCFAAYNAWQCVGPFPLTSICDMYIVLLFHVLGLGCLFQHCSTYLSSVFYISGLLILPLLFLLCVVLCDLEGTSVVI